MFPKTNIPNNTFRSLRNIPKHSRTSSAYYQATYIAYKRRIYVLIYQFIYPYISFYISHLINYILYNSSFCHLMNLLCMPWHPRLFVQLLWFLSGFCLGCVWVPHLPWKKSAAGSKFLWFVCCIHKKSAASSTFLKFLVTKILVSSS